MLTEVTEQSILEALHRVPQEKWGLVLEILHNLEPREEALPPQGADPGCWTARQLLALPLAERDAIIEAQALLAVDDYPIGLDDDYDDYSNDTGPERGEIWLVDFDPSVGAEIQKIRPAVVLSQDGLRHLAVRVVVPITEWKAAYAGRFWHVQLSSSPANGLRKDSGADAFQVKSVSERRFSRCLGVVSANELGAIANAVAAVVGKP